MASSLVQCWQRIGCASVEEMYIAALGCCELTRREDKDRGLAECLGPCFWLLYGAELVQYPLIGGGAHDLHSGLRRFQLGIRSVSTRNGEEPVQGVLLVCDVPVEAGGGLVDDTAHEVKRSPG